MSSSGNREKWYCLKLWMSVNIFQVTTTTKQTQMVTCVPCLTSQRCGEKEFLRLSSLSVCSANRLQILLNTNKTAGGSLMCPYSLFFISLFFAPHRLQAVFLSGKIQNRPTTRLIWFSHICCFISLAEIRRSGASVRLSIGRRQVSHQPPPTISYPPHWNRPQMEMV